MASLKNDLRELGKLAPRQKALIVVFLFVLFLIGWLLGVYFIQPKSSPLISQPVVTPHPTRISTTTLSLSPSSQTLKVGEALPVSVILSDEPVQAVDVVLNFDPTVFSASQIQKGELFPMILKENIKPGTIEFSASASPDNPVATSSGSVFSVMLTALSSTSSATVDFDAEQTITAKGGRNTLGQTVGGRYTVE